MSVTEKMAIAASENYQLKWHSYGAHLHSSVATLLHSESFADVLLATSCGRHVAAHRFVLAACSSYLSHIFQTCHFGANTNAPIIVVGISNSLSVILFTRLLSNLLLIRNGIIPHFRYCPQKSDTAR